MWLDRGKNLVLWKDGKIFTNDDDTDNYDNDNQKLHAAYNKLLKCVFQDVAQDLVIKHKVMDSLIQFHHNHTIWQWWYLVSYLVQCTLSSSMDTLYYS